MKKLSASFFTIVFLLLLFPAKGASAYDGQVQLHFSADSQTAVPGEEVCFSVSAAANFTDRLSTFRIRFTFDDSRLQYTGVSAAGEMENSEYKTYCSGSQATVIYLTGSNGFAVEPDKTAELFTLRFKVKKAAAPGQTEIFAQADGFATDAVQAVDATKSMAASVMIRQPAAPDLNLRYLQPDTGGLTPDFRPEITDYTLQVPSSVDSVTMVAQAADPQAVVRVSRRTLEKAGTSTLIKVTVRSSDGKDERAYRVTVLRAKGSATAQAENSAVGKAAAARKGAGGTSDDAEDDDADSVSHGTGGAVEALSAEKPNARTLVIKTNSFGAFLAGILLCAGLAGGGLFAARLLKKKKAAGGSANSGDGKSAEK